MMGVALDTTMGRGSYVVACMPILAALLVGCAGSEPEDATGPAGDPGTGGPLPARELGWSMTGCQFIATLIEVPASAVEPFVPEGFRVMSISEFSLEGAAGEDIPEDPRENGNIGVEAFVCEEGQGLDAVEPGMTYASFYTGVDPPTEFERPGVPFYFVKWDVMVPDQPRRELLASYGVPVHEGTSTVETTVLGASATQVSGSLDFGPFGAFSLSGTSAMPFPDDVCGFVEYTPVPAGLVEWTMSCSFVNGGVGPETVTVPEGSWFAEVVGPGEHDAVGFLGIVDFASGSIKLPASA